MKQNIKVIHINNVISCLLQPQLSFLNHGYNTISRSPKYGMALSTDCRADSDQYEGVRELNALQTTKILSVRDGLTVACSTCGQKYPGIHFCHAPPYG